MVFKGLCTTESQKGLFENGQTNMGATTPQVCIQPKWSLMDESVQIAIQGLKAGKHITLAACLTDEKHTFVSYAYYMADRNGEVTLSDMASTGGTYVGQLHQMLSAKGKVRGRTVYNFKGKGLQVRFAVNMGFHCIIYSKF